MLNIRLFSAALFLALDALLGIAVVHERSAALTLRYQLAQTLAAERRLDEDLTRARTILSSWQNPLRLELLIRRGKLPLSPLQQSTVIQEIPYAAAATHK